MLWPFLFLPLLSPRFALIFPWFFVAFALNYTPYYTIGYQYSFVVIPFFVVASVYGMKRLLSHVGTLNWRKISNMLVISALIFSVWGIVSFQFPLVSFNAGYANRANQVINLIPENASVLTINSLEPHISSRYDVWVLPLTYTEPYPGYDTGISTVWKEYTNNFLTTTEPDFILWNINSGGIDAYNLNLTIHELLSRVHYGVYALSGEILLLKKGYNETPLIYSATNRTFNFENLTIYAPCQIIKDSTSTSGTVLFYNASNENGTFLETPSIFLPEGRYTIKIGIKASGITNTTVNMFMLGVNMGNENLNFTVSTMGMEENEWKEAYFEFNVTDTLAYVSLKGTALNTHTEFYIDYIDLSSTAI
jgi:hypothetical protein